MVKIQLENLGARALWARVNGRQIRLTGTFDDKGVTGTGGVVASIVLIPLAGIAYLAVGRNPLAGLALGFAAVAGAFTVNMLIKPLDCRPFSAV